MYPHFCTQVAYPENIRDCSLATAANGCSAKGKNTHNPETNEPDRKEKKMKMNRNASGTERSTTASKSVKLLPNRGVIVSIAFPMPRIELLKFPSLETQELSQTRASVGLRLAEIVAGGLQMAEALLDDAVDAVAGLGRAFQVLDGAHAGSGHGALE